jgi:hypothetical protein
VSIKADDDFRTDAMIGPHYVSVLFGIELGGEFRGVHQVTKQHRELAAFRLERSGGG